MPRPTAIPGLLFLPLTVHGDARGWFKENWQRAKMTELGLPDFQPVQQNVSYNESLVTRGFHAEQWDKLVSVADGRVFGAWVDLRAGPGFGRVDTATIDPGLAVFVPRGVANAYQSLAPGTAYMYLVNEHWSPDATAAATHVNLADPALAVPWPHALETTARSDADLKHPILAEVAPIQPLRTVVLGGDGQVGRALRDVLPDATFLTRQGCDLAVPEDLDAVNWSTVGTVINAAAYTAVDAAETEEGRRHAWAVNVAAVGHLVRLARRYRLTLVHVSSDYVFDGMAPEYDETASFAPLSTYGATKAAGDALVASWNQHYIVRTSWIVGTGHNFVSTMARLADEGISPGVVDDQVGRLTFATDLAAAIVHLVSVAAPFGTYNMANTGPPLSWADVAEMVFTHRGRESGAVTRLTTAEYGSGKRIAQRPARSVLALEKIHDTGYEAAPMTQRLSEALDAMPRPTAP